MDDEKNPEPVHYKLEPVYDDELTAENCGLVRCPVIGSGFNGYMEPEFVFDRVIVDALREGRVKRTKHATREEMVTAVAKSLTERQVYRLFESLGFKSVDRTVALTAIDKNWQEFVVDAESVIDTLFSDVHY